MSQGRSQHHQEDRQTQPFEALLPEGWIGVEQAVHGRFRRSQCFVVYSFNDSANVGAEQAAPERIKLRAFWNQNTKVVCRVWVFFT